MRHLIMCAAGAAMLTAAGASPSFAQKWVELGSRSVADNTETDVISARGDGRFSAIRLCVKRRAVAFKDLDVVYGNGRPDDLQIRRRIGPGQCTRAIDLKGNRRKINRIVMRYETIRDKGPQAIVTVYGRR